MGNYDAEAVVVEAPIGSVIFAHGACWHSGGLNATSHPRTGIFGRYARSYIIPQEDMKCQLADIKEPTPLVSRLMGARQYVPRKAIPY
jgi:ectoine hydroxylase-related dioxygenase (phytanoyl-CoA dioxygenase family)